MTKIATINDIHIGVKGDAKSILDYQERFFKEIFFPTLIKNDVKTILCGGDVFDRRKYINFQTLNRAKKMFFDVAQSLGIIIYVIPGNHDTFYKDDNEVNSLNECLYGYNNIKIIEEPRKLSFGNCDIMMLPWLNEKNREEYINYINSNDADILYGHLEISGFEMYSGMKSDHGMDSSFFKKFKRVWSGHYHHQSSIGNIHYLGAPMEFTWADYKDDRGFHIYDTETNELEFIKNPINLYEKIFYADETLEQIKEIQALDLSKYDGKIIKLFVTKKTNNELFEKTIDSLYQRNLIDLTVMEDYSGLSTEGEEIIDEHLQDSNNSTKDLMEKYVDNFSVNLDKTKIKTILNELYIEALNTEVK